MATVRVKHIQFSSRFRLPDRAATELLKATVPPARREYDEAARRWVVFSTAVPALLSALTEAGYLTEEDGST